jgi:23S rRNA (cytidine1920-2'-O)/16S rRNA (cytidine1409-2'-O)-methyltransferase
MVRADLLLLASGQVESRDLAQRLIMAGEVRTAAGDVVAKACRKLPGDTVLQIRKKPPYVSRGGEKLAGFFRCHRHALAGVHALDIGASTGGFTDYLLKNGAASVTCVDVGHGQLHLKLRQDPRVTNFEKVNARHLSAISLPRPCYDLIVMDLSFISLKTVLPATWPLLEGKGLLVALVKPQFEAGRREVSIGRGVITDPAIHRRVLGELRTFALDNLPGARIVAEVPSPLVGMDGNREFFLGIAIGQATDAAQIDDVFQARQLLQSTQNAAP